MDLVVFIAAVLAHAPPVVFAVLGETITEKAGVINLSLDGSIMLSAMVGFAVASETGSVLAGFTAAMVVGAVVALTIAFLSLTLHQPQVATGFVLTLLCRDLAFVFGNAYTGRPAVLVPHTPIPGLEGLPVIGTILFNQNPIVYLSLVAIFLAWFYISRTRVGLELQGLGERPAAAYARGVRVTLLRYLYTAAGGALVGLGGASFSLLVDPGWSRPCGFQGIGWIALAIVIFGNWQPIRASVGVYFFVTLQMLASTLQSAMPKVPTQVFPTLPFPIMILTLLLVTVGNAEWVHRALSDLPAPVRRFALRVLMALQTSPPAALGTVLKKE
jgi:ABC-type uncharacterized transport system permease subunit